MRERERKSRSQIAQQAARDTFMEQASGAVFAEPIKVSRRSPGHGSRSHGAHQVHGMDRRPAFLRDRRQDGW